MNHFRCCYIGRGRLHAYHRRLTSSKPRPILAAIRMPVAANAPAEADRFHSSRTNFPNHSYRAHNFCHPHLLKSALRSITVKVKTKLYARLISADEKTLMAAMSQRARPSTLSCLAIVSVNLLFTATTGAVETNDTNRLKPHQAMGYVDLYTWESPQRRALSRLCRAASRTRRPHNTPACICTSRGCR